jgi:hypothetical protein
MDSALTVFSSIRQADDTVPLKRAPGVPKITSDWVEFPMLDSLTKKLVSARASYGVLRKIGGNVASSQSDLLGVFLGNRDRLEAMANAKYIAGQSPPHLFPEDL